MLGRLARWLRAAGYDTAYTPDLDDQALLRRARAEGRVLLTADRDLARSHAARTFLVAGGDLTAQLTQVLQALGPPPSPPFSRCLACNGMLEPIPKTDLAGRLPPYILARHEQFSRCPNCQHLYWPGTHWDRMREKLGQLLE